MEAGQVLNNLLMLHKDIDRIIELTWEDTTTFEAIKIQFGFSGIDLIAHLRRELKHSSFYLCRKLVNSGFGKKQALKRNPVIAGY
jgi:uncharacterized protein (TIGR03643 family)